MVINAKLLQKHTFEPIMNWQESLLVSVVVVYLFLYGSYVAQSSSGRENNVRVKFLVLFCITSLHTHSRRSYKWQQYGINKKKKKKRIPPLFMTSCAVSGKKL